MATLKELSALWERDSDIDQTNLGDEAARTTKLHSSYLTYLAAERIALRKIQAERDLLFHHKTEWMLGRLSREELAELGWKPFQEKVMKSDIERFMSADMEMVRKNHEVAIQMEKVEFLKAIMDQIKQRGFLIKSAQDWLKYISGA